MIKNIIVRLCILTSLGFGILYGQASSTQLTIDDLERGHPDAKHQLEQELQFLQAHYPKELAGRQFEKLLNVFSPIGTEADLLFLAAKVCEYQVEKFYQQFPALSYIYEPIFLGDLDYDGEKEVLCHRTITNTAELVVFYKDQQKIVQEISHKFALRLILSIQQSPNGYSQIVGRFTGSRRLPVKDRKQMGTLEYIKETIWRFSKGELEEIQPFMTIHEEIVLDE